MYRPSVFLTGAAVTAGFLTTAAPAAAEIFALDCEVSVDSRNVSEGRPGRNSGDSRGTWRVRVFDYQPNPSFSEVRFTDSAPFGVFYYSNTLDTDFLEHAGENLITEDRIEWCPDFRGCEAQIPYHFGDGWYRVSKAVIDRRRGTLAVSVSTYDRTAGLRMDYTYRGTCAPEPEQQF